MGPVPIALILVASLAVAFFVARRVERRYGRDRGMVTLMALAAVPFVLLVIPPAFDDDDDDEPASASSPPCRIAGSRATGFEARPGSCRPGAPGVGYVLEEGAIRPSEGRRIRLMPKAVSGYVDTATLTGGRPRVSGWAANLEAGRPASAILFFSDGRFAGAVKPTVSRPDVARDRGRSALRTSGFNVELPPGVAATSSLGVFALDGAVASRVSLNCSSRRLAFGC